MQIQRIQSLYLLIACVSLVLFACMPIAQVNTADASLLLTSLGLKTQGIEPGVADTYVCHTWPVLVCSVAGALIALIAIFKFNQMRLQRVLCVVTALLTLAAAVVAFIVSYAGAQQVTFSGWCITPFLALLFSILAYIAIGKDQKLLRSINHFR